MENVATREYIEGLGVGSPAPTCFGTLKKIVNIFGLGNDIKGKKYICYYTEFSENSTMSHSLTEGEPVHII